MGSAQWDGSPLLPARVAYEVGRLLDRDAFVVIESAERFGMDFDPLHGPTYMASRGGYLGFGVGGAAGTEMYTGTATKDGKQVRFQVDSSGRVTEE